MHDWSLNSGETLWCMQGSHSPSSCSHSINRLFRLPLYKPFSHFSDGTFTSLPANTSDPWIENTDWREPRSTVPVCLSACLRDEPECEWRGCMGQELVNYRHRGLSWGCLLERAGAGTSGRTEKAYGILHDGYGSSRRNIGLHLTIQHKLHCTAWFYSLVQNRGFSWHCCCARCTRNVAERWRSSPWSLLYKQHSRGTPHIVKPFV